MKSLNGTDESIGTNYEKKTLKLLQVEKKMIEKNWNDQTGQANVYLYKNEQIMK